MTAQGKAAFRLSDTPGWCDTELELASGLRGRRKEKEEKERPRGLPGPPQRALDTHGEDPGISWPHLADPRWIGTSLPHGVWPASGAQVRLRASRVRPLPFPLPPPPRRPALPPASVSPLGHLYFSFSVSYFFLKK